MNDLTPMLLMLAIMNKKGFNSIKNAIEAAEGFSSKINNLTGIMNILPNMTSMLSGMNTLLQPQSQNTARVNEGYVDTLKDVLSGISK